MAIKIANRQLGKDHPPFIIAEMSGNHNQSLDPALARMAKAVPKWSGWSAPKTFSEVAKYAGH